MNITYLIGNGFDVNLGLKTRYTDFYGRYFEENQYTDNDCIKGFIDKIKSDYENWSDFEAAFAEQFEGTQIEAGQILSNFCDLFSKYLREECEKCDYSSSKEINKELRKFLVEPFPFLERRDSQILKSFYNAHIKEDTHYRFINFNYTDTLEKLLQNPYDMIIDKQHIGGNALYNNTIGNILYLHGSINEEYIIIGIDSLKQLKGLSPNTNEYRMARTCVKTKINSDNGYQDKEEDFIEVINKSNIIYTYGISFGETDRSRWDVISNWLAVSASNKLVIYKYESGFSEYESKHRSLLHDKIDDTRLEYLEKICSGNQERFNSIKQDYTNRIFVIDSSKALNFRLVEKELAAAASE